MNIKKYIRLSSLLLLVALSMMIDIDARRGGGRGGRRGGGRSHSVGRRGGSRGYRSRGGRGYRGRGRRYGRRHGRRHRRRHGGWRGGRYRRGYGYGYGYGPWYYGWPTVAVVSSDYTDDYDDHDYRDRMELPYWEIHNATSNPIYVSTAGLSESRIAPGYSAQLNRGASFTVNIRGTDNQRTSISTHDHFIEVYEDRGGYLRKKSWNE